MRMRLMVRIDLLKKYHGEVFNSNIDFGIQHGYAELAVPLTDWLPTAYCHL